MSSVLANGGGSGQQMLLSLKQIKFLSLFQQIISADGNTRVVYVGQEKPDVSTELFKTRLNIYTGNQNKQPQTVRHFQWRNWPDRGVPRNHLAALRLLHFIQPYKRIVVHCSAGRRFGL